MLPTPSISSFLNCGMFSLRLGLEVQDGTMFAGRASVLLLTGGIIYIGSENH